MLQLQGTENSAYIDLLRLFAHGTWTDYKSKKESCYFYLVSPCFVSSYMYACVFFCFVCVYVYVNWNNGSSSYRLCGDAI